MQIVGGGSVKGRRWGAGEGKQATGVVPRFASGSAVLTAAVGAGSGVSDVEADPNP